MHNVILLSLIPTVILPSVMLTVILPSHNVHCYPSTSDVNCYPSISDTHCPSVIFQCLSEFFLSRINNTAIDIANSFFYNISSTQVTHSSVDSKIAHKDLCSTKKSKQITSLVLHEHLFHERCNMLTWPSTVRCENCMVIRKSETD